MSAPEQAESAAKERLARLAQRIREHDRETERANAAFAAARAELTAMHAAAREEVEREEALAGEVFSVLPRELVRFIFLLLPVDVRMRCREVCPAWCCLLEERWLWRECDLSPSSGVQRATKALLRAASRRAGGQLRVLDVSGWPEERALPVETLRAVAEENGATRTELRKPGKPGCATLTGLLVNCSQAAQFALLLSSVRGCAGWR